MISHILTPSHSNAREGKAATKKHQRRNSLRKTDNLSISGKDTVGMLLVGVTISMQSHLGPHCYLRCVAKTTFNGRGIEANVGN